jgi:membrane carboxypeptidase/penicillin-binding protein PbpC
VWDIPSQQADSLNIPQPTVFHGPLNIRSAIAEDTLTPLALLINQFGPARVWKTGSDLGFSSLSSADNTIAPLFSGSDASLPEIAAMFSTLANGGVRAGIVNPSSKAIRLNTVRWISTVSGRIILENSQPARATIVSDALAYLVNNVLSDTSARWPYLGYPNALEIGSNAAARTGSTEDGHQVWTVGYDPQLLALIWVGNDGAGASAPSLDVRMPAGIWHAIFRYATRDTGTISWTRPLSVTEMKVCVPSGMLPTPLCPEVKSDVFLLGNEPTLPDSLYYQVKVNRETGQRATVFTQLDLVEEKVFMNVPEEAHGWAENAGITLAPAGYDTIQPPRLDPLVNIAQPALFTAVSGVVKITGTASVEDFSSYTVQVGEGINPDNWFQVGQSTTPVTGSGTLASWDTTDLEGLYAIRLTVVTKNNLIHTALSQVTVDNLPPLVSLRYPAADEQAPAVQGGVTLLGEVSDQVGISRLEWWLDGKLVATQSNPPFAYFLTGNSGSHQVQLKAWDLAGNQASTDKITFEIVP